MYKKILLTALALSVYSVADLGLPQGSIFLAVLILFRIRFFRKLDLFVTFMFFSLAVIFDEFALGRLSLIFAMMVVVNGFVRECHSIREDFWRSALVVIILGNFLSLIPETRMSSLSDRLLDSDSEEISSRDELYYSFKRPSFLTNETNHGAKFALVALFMIRNRVLFFWLLLGVVFRSPAILLGLLHPAIHTALLRRKNIFPAIAGSIIGSALFWFQYDRIGDMLNLSDDSFVQRIYVPLIALFSSDTLTLGTFGEPFYNQQWVTLYLKSYLIEGGYQAPHLLRLIIEWGLIGVFFCVLVLARFARSSILPCVLFASLTDNTYTPYPWILFILFACGYEFQKKTIKLETIPRKAA